MGRKGWEDEDVAVNICEQRRSKGEGQGKGHPWCIEHCIYFGSVQLWWWALSAGTNQTLAKKRGKTHG